MTDYSDDFEMSPVYYRLYGTPDGPRVITMQWFDEPDYDEAKFLNEEQYDREEDAETALQTLLAESSVDHDRRVRIVLDALYKALPCGDSANSCLQFTTEFERTAQEIVAALDAAN